MKNTKKLLALLLSVVMLLSFVGCDLDTAEYDGTSSIESSSTISSTNDSEQTNDVLDGQKPSASGEQSKPTEKPSNNVVETGAATAVDPSTLPAFSGTVYTTVNNNQPNFSAAELTTVGYEKYSSLDSLNRFGVALASCGKEIMPGENEKRKVLVVLSLQVGYRKPIVEYPAVIYGTDATLSDGNFPQKMQISKTLSPVPVT